MKTSCSQGKVPRLAPFFCLLTCVFGLLVETVEFDALETKTPLSCRPILACLESGRRYSRGVRATQFENRVEPFAQPAGDTTFVFPYKLQQCCSFLVYQCFRLIPCSLDVWRSFGTAVLSHGRGRQVFGLAMRLGAHPVLILPKAFDTGPSFGKFGQCCCMYLIIMHPTKP